MTSPRFPDGMSVRTKTLAVRMYGFASAREWNLTLADLADIVGVPVERARRVSQMHGWTRRFRASQPETICNTHRATVAMDRALEDMGAR